MIMLCGGLAHFQRLSAPQVWAWDDMVVQETTRGPEQEAPGMRAFNDMAKQISKRTRGKKSFHNSRLLIAISPCRSSISCNEQVASVLLSLRRGGPATRMSSFQPNSSGRTSRLRRRTTT